MTAADTPGRELLACPFCGKPPTYEHRNSFHQILCAQRGCVIVDVTESTYKEAARRWNTRLAAKPADEPDNGLLDIYRQNLIEECAKIAEPWPGFSLDENSTDVDRAVVAVRTEIAKTIRGLAQPTRDGAEGAGEPVASVVSDEAWQRALDCAYSCLDKKFISKGALNNAMQHAFGMLSLRKATPPVRGDREEGIGWRRVNGEPFEYAIQQGPHGDEFVKLLNGCCLRLPVQPGAGERGSDAAEADRYFEMAGEFGNRIQRAVTLIEDYDRHGSVDHSVTFEVKKILDPESALSSQAPHSSSGTGK